VERFPPSLTLTEQPHVVRIPLDAYGDAMELWPLLDDEERRRAGRFVQADHRRRFIAAHALTRLVLGRSLGLAPDAIRFRIHPRGKPAVVTPGADVEFTLSHSGERALLCVTRGRAVGVDIERLRAIDALRISRNFFSPVEHETLAAVPPAELLPAFFRCWTRKESFVKATGEGLSWPLTGFHVSHQLQVANALLGCDRDADAASRWTILPLTTDDGYTAALTVAGSAGAIGYWDAPRPIW